MLCLTNYARQHSGLSPLSLSPTLTTAAPLVRPPREHPDPGLRGARNRLSVEPGVPGVRRRRALVAAIRSPHRSRGAGDDIEAGRAEAHSQASRPPIPARRSKAGDGPCGQGRAPLDAADADRSPRSRRYDTCSGDAVAANAHERDALTGRGSWSGASGVSPFWGISRRRLTRLTPRTCSRLCGHRCGR
jgi:hypothetical protein